MFILNVLLILLFSKSEDGSIYFSGYSKMSLPIDNFMVVEVAKPNLGN